jgi:hypothetical protein
LRSRVLVTSASRKDSSMARSACDSSQDSGWNPPETAPKVSDPTLQNILDQIYARPGVQVAWGNGTVQDAVMFEKTNDAAAIDAAFGGRLHTLKAAQILNQLSKLLEEDEADGSQLLTGSERDIALSETRSLLDALTAPDESGVTTSWLNGNPGRLQSYDGALKNASDSLDNVSESVPRPCRGRSRRYRSRLRS